MAVKVFVLDTNVLLHDAAALTAFKDNNVAVPIAVLEELDKFKRNQDELGRNARRVIRDIDRLRLYGSLRKGVSMEHLPGTATGLLIISGSLEEDYSQMLSRMEKAGWSMDYADNRILCTALRWNETEQVVFVSKDINLRLKADALGLKVMDFERDKVQEEDVFTGWKSFEAEGEEEAAAQKGEAVGRFANLQPNEFAFTGGGSSLFRRMPDGKVFQLPYPGGRVWNITPRNREQTMALELLADPAVQLVTLTGGAGTGKTLLALAAGLQGIFSRNLYERILVSRPIVPLGNDLGFLPGAKNDKLASWMQPIFDNLEVLLPPAEQRENTRKSSSSSQIRMTADSLLHSKKLELEAITYIRGRSIPGQYVIIDEAQNLTPHEVKTIISRAGEGTKIILTGDPAQIDNPYLDTSSNGLSFCIKKFAPEKIAGHVTLTSSERSPLAALAAKLL